MGERRGGGGGDNHSGREGEALPHTTETAMEEKGTQAWRRASYCTRSACQAWHEEEDDKERFFWVLMWIDRKQELIFPYELENDCTHCTQVVRYGMWLLFLPKYWSRKELWKRTNPIRINVTFIAREARGDQRLPDGSQSSDRFNFMWHEKTLWSSRRGVLISSLPSPDGETASRAKEGWETLLWNSFGSEGRSACVKVSYPFPPRPMQPRYPRGASEKRPLTRVPAEFSCFR